MLKTPMSHDELTKLFSYMEQKFDAIDKRFDRTEDNIRGVKLGLAEFGGQLKDTQEELLAVSHKTDRLECWIHEIADHVGAKLSAA